MSYSVHCWGSPTTGRLNTRLTTDRSWLAFRLNTSVDSGGAGPGPRSGRRNKSRVFLEEREMDGKSRLARIFAALIELESTEFECSR